MEYVSFRRLAARQAHKWLPDLQVAQADDTLDVTRNLFVQLLLALITDCPPAGRLLQLRCTRRQHFSSRGAATGCWNRAAAHGDAGDASGGGRGSAWCDGWC